VLKLRLENILTTQEIEATWNLETKSVSDLTASLITVRKGLYNLRRTLKAETEQRMRREGLEASRTTEIRRKGLLKHTFFRLDRESVGDFAAQVVFGSCKQR
jgi:hypothetical protein